MIKELEAQVRSGRNKRQKGDLLKRGFIPALVYGKNMDSFAISVSANELKKILGEAGSKKCLCLSPMRTDLHSLWQEK